MFRVSLCFVVLLATGCTSCTELRQDNQELRIENERLAAELKAISQERAILEMTRDNGHLRPESK